MRNWTAALFTGAAMVTGAGPALALLAAPANAGQDHSVTVDNWTVAYRDGGDGACTMTTHYTLADGARSSFQFWVGGDGSDLIVLRNSRWAMPDRETTAEVWVGGDSDRRADATVKATLHRLDGETHIDLHIDYALLERFDGVDAAVVRVRDTSVFDHYELGKASEAMWELFDCADAMLPW